MRTKCKNIFLAWMLILSLCFQPVMVFAETTTEVSEENTVSGYVADDSVADTSETEEEVPAEMDDETGAEDDEPQDISYDLKVAGVLVNNQNAADVLGDGTVSYDIATNTLTLSDLEVSVEQGNYGIRVDNGEAGALNLVLKGSNKISCSDYYGIYAAGALNISGDGSLDTYGTDGGIYVKGSVTIGDKVQVTSKCGDVASGRAFGIRVNDDLTIQGEAIVSAESGSAPGNSIGIYCGDELVISGSASVTGKSGSSDEYSYAITSDDNLTISENAWVTAIAGNGSGRSCGTYVISNIYMNDDAKLDTTGIDTSESDDLASESYGIRSTRIFASGGTINAAGDGATGISAGIFTQNMEISGGRVNASSINAKTAQSVGVQASKTLVISDGILNANSGDTTADSWAVDASGTMTVTGGTVIAVTGTGDRTYGIQSNEITISGGRLIVEASDAVSQSRGIQSFNALSISDCYVSAKSGNADSQSYGLQASTVLDITDADIVVSSGEGRKSSGIYAGEAIHILDTTAEITSQGNGIYAPYGSILIGSTKVTLSEVPSLLVGTTIHISASNYGIYAAADLTIDETLTISTPEKGIIVQAEEQDQVYYYVGDQNENTAGNVKIEPLAYYVTMKGLDQGKQVLVAAGKSVNELYCERLGVEDFSEAVNTTREGYIFKGFFTDKKCTDGNEYSFDTPVTENITIYAKWEKICILYDVVVESSTGGQVHVSNRTPEAGEKITIKVSPDRGYKIDQLLVLDEKGNEINVIKGNGSTYIFEQPESNVTVKVSFQSYKESGKETIKNFLDHITEGVQTKPIVESLNKVVQLMKDLFKWQ